MGQINIRFLRNFPIFESIFSFFYILLLKIQLLFCSLLISRIAWLDSAVHQSNRMLVNPVDCAKCNSRKAERKETSKISNEEFIIFHAAQQTQLETPNSIKEIMRNNSTHLREHQNYNIYTRMKDYERSCVYAKIDYREGTKACKRNT